MDHDSTAAGRRCEGLRSKATRVRSLVAWQFGLFLRNTRCTEIYPTLSHHSEAGKVGLAPRQYVVTGNLGIRWSKLPVLQRAERTTYGATFNAILISRTAWPCMVKLLRDLWSFLDIQNLAENLDSRHHKVAMGYCISQNHPLDRLNG